MTFYFVIKIALSAFVVATVSEVAKRSGFWGALLASLPLTSILAMLWLYKDTKDVHQISRLSTGVFWLVLPSLVLFLVLPAMLKAGWNFYPSLFVASSLTVGAYLAMTFVLKFFGVQI